MTTPPVASIRASIQQAVLEIARTKQPTLQQIGLDQRLVADLGLESLDLAQLVAELEFKLGVDPFGSETVSQVVTVGDLVAVYERKLG